MDIFYAFFTLIVIIVTISVSTREKKRSIVICTFCWGAIMLLIFYLAVYINSLFGFIGFPICAILAIIWIALKKHECNSSFWGSLIIITLLLMLIAIVTGVFSVMTHRVIVEYSVTVTDGNVTINTDELPDELTKFIHIDIDSLVEKPDGVYLQETVISYECVHKTFDKWGCNCTKKEICDVCKDTAILKP